MTENDQSLRENFWDIACGVEPLWRFLLVLVVILLAMLGMSFPFVERGTGSYYISLIAAANLLPLLVASAYVLRRCSMRNRRRPEAEGETAGSEE